MLNLKICTNFHHKSSSKMSFSKRVHKLVFQLFDQIRPMIYLFPICHRFKVGLTNILLEKRHYLFCNCIVCPYDPKTMQSCRHCVETQLDWSTKRVKMTLNARQCLVRSISLINLFVSICVRSTS